MHVFGRSFTWLVTSPFVISWIIYIDVLICEHTRMRSASFIQTNEHHTHSLKLTRNKLLGHLFFARRCHPVQRKVLQPNDHAGGHQFAKIVAASSTIRRIASVR